MSSPGIASALSSVSSTVPPALTGTVSPTLYHVFKKSVIVSSHAADSSVVTFLATHGSRGGSTSAFVTHLPRNRAVNYSGRTLSPEGLVVNLLCIAVIAVAASVATTSLTTILTLCDTPT